MATAESIEAIHEMDEHTKPAFLRRVRIRGYKSIAACDVTLQPLTVLVGRNAAGKSNFLDALSFLRDVLETNVTEAVKRHGGWSSLICRTAETPYLEIEIEVGFTCRPSDRRVRVNGLRNAVASSAESVLDLTSRRFVATYLLQIAGGEQVPPVVRRETLDLTDETGKSYTGFYLHRDSAGIPQALLSGSKQIIEGGLVLRGGEDELFWRGPVGSPDASKEAMQAIAPDRSNYCLLGTLGSQPYSDLADQIRSMGFYNIQSDAIRRLQKPLPGVLLDKDGSNLASVIRSLEERNPNALLRVQEYLALIAEEVEQFAVHRYGEYETIRFRLRSETADQPVEFDAESMSDGTLRALAHILAAFQNVLPYGYPSVVGIEEPETSLHPAAATAPLAALDEATAHTQVLVTTHSTEFLNDRDLNPSQVLVVRSRNHQTQIAPLDPASLEIIGKKLYTLADLQRMDHLEPDAEDLNRQAKARTTRKE